MCDNELEAIEKLLQEKEGIYDGDHDLNMNIATELYHDGKDYGYIKDAIMDDTEEWKVAFLYCVDFGLSVDESIEVCDDYLDYVYNSGKSEPVLAIYNDSYDAGKETIESFIDIPDFLEYYIDYEGFGDDLEEPYFELSGGRIIYLNM